jgi:hypothetical protein
MNDTHEELGVCLTITRVRATHNWQYKPYHALTMDATLEITDNGGEKEEAEVIAEGVRTINHGFGLAMLLILKRYDENRQIEELQGYLNAIIPSALKITLKENEVLMDGLLMAAQTMLAKENGHASK